MTALPSQHDNENEYRGPAATGLHQPICFNHIQLFSEQGLEERGELPGHLPP
jgi:hypothetical protein